MSTTKPVWFVTAASSGFGREISLEALRRGHTVVATARTPDRIQDLVDAGAHALAFDVTSPIQKIESTARQVFEKHGRVDYLVNAAGFIIEGALEETTPEEVYDCFNTNVFGMMNTIQAFLPHIRSQAIGPRGIRATVVTFGSLGSWEGGASYSTYAMTKVCASSLAESLREELTPFKIRCTAIEPGYFRTGFLNPGRKVTAKARIDAYEDINTPSGQARKGLDATDGNQLGDVKKGCKIIVDVLTETGVGANKELPVRIVLGSDCEQTIRNKCTSTIKLLDEWKGVAQSSDHS
ncbi:hypothetical protein HIM_05154 [Hirsutella minnesotensis 3608]|uniref:Uncharacterized protein n=1 Tax=Hirsutella minnesotensis 3608 TaxID=1043627 RepID=A0A0F7ZUU2_9HYPO|nr:hypothetical protein HIM_05154 [Hirsutella minnesotensis 3608]